MSTTNKTKTTPKNDDKVLFFDEVTVIQFPIILGDNPSCTSGAPIQLGWKPIKTETHDMDVFEYMRRQQRRKSYKELKIPVPERAQMLVQAGYSIDKIATAVMKVQEAQKERAESIQANGMSERLQLLMETTGRLPVEFIRGALRTVSSSPKNKLIRKTVQARMA